MPVTSDDGLRRLLDLTPIAVIGCSSTPSKAANRIPKYLQQHGYRIVPVNPTTDEILGEPAYDRLADIPVDVELVDVFRPSPEVSGIVDQVLERADDRGDVDAVWLQLGIRDDEAAARAEDAGVDVVQDKCLKVEHSRLLG
jgi:predicted CoA-binding protein